MGSPGNDGAIDGGRRPPRPAGAGLLRGLLLLLALPGCRGTHPSDWDRAVECAQEFRRGRQTESDAILDGLEARARDSLQALRHPESRPEWEERIPRIRQELRFSLGLDRLAPAKPQNVRTVGTLIRDGCRIEKLVYETFPQVQVPAHLYLPVRPEGRVPGILFVPGHWYADSKTRPDFQAFALSMARQGMAVLIYDPIGQGERGISIRDHRRTELLAVGVAQEAIVVFESECALEILLARPEIDPTRIGMTGASGGGFNSWIVSALDPRISVTIPVVGTSDFLEQMRAVRSGDWFGAKEHCHFVPRLFRYANNHELLACVAPRPVMVISAHHDVAFPVPGQRNVVKYGEALYQALGAAGRVGYFEDQDEGHGYQKRKREAAYGWFLKWLRGQGDGSPVEETGVTASAWDDPELHCFAGPHQSAGPGLLALAKSIASRPPEPDSGEDGLRRRLCSRLGLRYPLPIPPAPDLMAEEPRLSIGQAPGPATSPCARVGWRSPDGVFVPAVLLEANSIVHSAVLVVSDQGKERALRSPAVESAYTSGSAVVSVDLRGMGELTLSRPGWVYAVSLMMGENLVARQALDLITGVRALKAEPWLRGKQIGVLATGPFASLAGLYAAVLEPGIAWLAAEEGFTSFRDFVFRPGSEGRSFALAEEGRERDIVLDREIPHALVPFGILSGPDIPDLLRALGDGRANWGAPVDGDFRRVEGSVPTLKFIQARLEESP